ncbi:MULTISPECIES: hypothetical protein [unclassified Enterobacter cloacae complex]|uniref:hypothetical protein n=1 Tax=Enterobacter cloacae complex TaxID=354276 RepID=UPI001872580B|nr:MULTISPECIES: hypothetical protein [unclassified Enterobacter cloacae complex]MBE4887279.1 hypothetical protein [Enterobacter cloacae complex sp. P37RS]MBE7431526.1 hypothetical protein [Enterobacter cloacae complex sp. P36RS]MCE1476572.1 hypothetical protein [Enterobacter hormaechei]
MLLTLLVSLSLNALLIYGIWNRDKTIKRLKADVSHNSMYKIMLAAKQVKESAENENQTL